MSTAKLSKREKAILLFYLKGTLSDLSKALIFFFIFYSLGFHKEFFYGLFFFVAFRVNSGGIHCKTYLFCFLLSLLLLSSGIILGSLIYLPKAYSILISMVCGFITCNLSPVQAATRPKASRDFIIRARIKEAMVIGIFILVLLTTETNQPINIGFWLLIIHTLQLYVAYKRR
ncbi:MAG: hypothetical protein E7257_08615 [Lachnospiraceae bacterium]|nr:hypothetical protein [Lachnospiraceae bacterium]MBQ9935237.1 accessory gene regulator B family protein [Lachnospiraceae bacterium]